MEKKRVRTITILFSKKIVINKLRIKPKRYEKKENERKKKKCNSFIINMYEKVYSFNIKYHDNVSI